MTRARSLLGLLVFVAAACEQQQSFVLPEPGLERMLEQPRVDPFQESSFYADGMAMRPLPRGVVPQERTLGPASFVEGIEHGQYAQQLPSIVDASLIERGRVHFDTLCAACHGVAGDGQSVVAENMALRRPPSLHEPRICEFAPGKMLRVVRDGYGLMPGYAKQLSVHESWGVVAYVRALQLSRNVLVASLPPQMRAELEENAR